MFSLFKKKKQSEEVQVKIEKSSEADAVMNEEAEIAAVITYALHKYRSEVHDFEQMIITMQKVMRPYSPWSSKIYGLRQYPIKMRTNF
ncbi:MAG TPA: OadG family protein [Ignavibacteriaceae bacterium]|nr:OadG family protein [Ignavibacteriaceae bacterium]